MTSPLKLLVLGSRLKTKGRPILKSVADDIIVKQTKKKNFILSADDIFVIITVLLSDKENADSQVGTALFLSSFCNERSIILIHNLFYCKEAQK